MNNRFIIITSINPPTQAVRVFATWPGWTTVVVGDRKSTGDWSLEGVVYLSIEDQIELFPEFARTLPENTYLRKMIGYLYAFKNGAKAIFESDDDNIPYAYAPDVVAGHLESRGTLEPTVSSPSGWLNIYSLFGAKECWPRGFPLQKIFGSESIICDQAAMPWGVIQYLADEDPDVDAVFRMTRGGAVYFAQARQFSLARSSFSPFNSQATLWVPETYPLMFLPLGVKDRVTDILRGYIALSCMWANGMTLGCVSPIVYQERNPHNLLNDFMQEFDLYVQGESWCATLLKISGGGMGKSFTEALQLLVEMQAIPSVNLDLYSEFQKHIKIEACK